MKIGGSTQPRSAISTSNEERIVVRGRDLCRDLIGRQSFTDYFHLLLTGHEPDAAARAVLDATLVAIAEHGFVPSVQAARLTFAAAPESLQGAVAAGLLGCGSVILGASEQAGRLFVAIAEREDAGTALDEAALAAVRAIRAQGAAIPGYGHPQHKAADPRVARLFEVAETAGADMRYVRIAQAVERAVPQVVGKPLRLNVSSAIPAVLLGVNYPPAALRGVPLLARAAGLIAHLAEEMETPSGFALSYQATRELIYEGAWPRD
jgi:citrate synthase